MDLPYCLSNDLQCCSADYLERVKEKVQQELNEGLRDEFQNVIDQFEDELDNLLDCEFKKRFLKFHTGSL